MAIENLTATTLRNIIGELDLDQTLTSRDIINTKMRAILDEATDPWGIKVNRVELKNIIPPKEIQDAMEKQMKAERERREQILKAEGEKNSTILIAEGQKQQLILAAEAEKESSILRAEAARIAKIKEAEGDAEAILKIQEATAQGIRMINEANPSEAVITIKSLEAFEKAADGIYVTGIKGLHAGANPITGDFSVESEGFLIKDGKKAGPVKSFTVAGNFFELLKKIDSLSNEVKWGIPGGFTVFGSPDVLLRDMSVAGK
jgi:regulator of protease activity HflC (stomatin/prohibitin superfamily)